MAWQTFLLIVLACGWAFREAWQYRQLDRARRSPVTDLPARWYFMRKARRVLRGKDPVVAFIDVDHLKRVNDTYGHEIGNRVLRTIADRLRQHFGPRAVVGQLHGDEFAVAAQMGQRVMRTRMLELPAVIARPIEVPTGPVHEAGVLQVTVSIGAVHAGAVARPSLSEMLEWADLLMYEAKELGRGRAQVYVAQAGDVSLRATRRHSSPGRGRLGSRAAWRRDETTRGVAAGGDRADNR